MKYVLTRIVELHLNPPINILQYPTKNALLCTILVIYLKIDLSKKFNLNSRYILIRVLDSDNKDNTTL